VDGARTEAGSRRALRAAALAAGFGGIAWLGLVPLVALVRSGALSYDGYFRLVALPLAGFVGAWALARPLIPSGRALTGWRVTLGGLALVFVGDVLEFWGAWLADEPTSHAAAETGSDAYWAADAGRSLFVLGFFALCAGGPTVAVGLRRQAGWPMWAATFLAVLGIGVLLATVLREAPLAPATLGLGAFAIGWLALAARLWGQSL
jgi:hypothetical protein